MSAIPSARPTHFLSLRVTNPVISNKIKNIQKLISASNPHLARHLIPPRKFHLTLFVMNLANLSHLDIARKTLLECSDFVPQWYANEQPSVHFRGLSHFGNRVLFADVHKDFNTRRLQSFAKQIHSQFDSKSLQTRFQFVPHLTILKIRNSKLNHGEDGTFSPSAWEPHKREDFGMHSFPQLELCAMMEEGDDGFYKSIEHISLIAKKPGLYTTITLQE